MNLIDARRVLRLGLVNYWRNLWLSLGSVLILTLTLVTITVSVVQNYDIRQTTNSIKGKLDITVYFDDSVPESDIKDIQLKLESRPDIKDVTYISKADALKIWQTRPTSGTVKDLVTPESNPLPRSILIHTYQSESLDTIAALFKVPALQSKIRRVSYEDNKQIIQDLIERNRAITQNGLVSSGLFVIISLIVIINTIRVIILTRRKELEVMRLVGASDFFVRAPLIVEALLTGFFAAALSSIFLYIGVSFNVPIIPSFSEYFGSGSELIKQIITQQIIIIFGLQLLVAFIITIITTLLSMQRYFKR